MSALIEIENISRIYHTGDETVVALDAVSLTIAPGEMIAIVGTSGSGKSTLMNILGCLDRPSSGSYRINGQETAAMMPDALARLRCQHFGFIFQRYHLLGDISAAANVEIPAIYDGAEPAHRRERSRALLARLGLGDRLHHYPNQLSGGQQQRVSIARALMNGGEIILADEPTGALDSKSGETVMTVLQELHQEGHTVILVTHDINVAEHADRIIEIHDGKIVADRRKKETIDKGPTSRRKDPAPQRTTRWRRPLDGMQMAFRAMATHRMRTFLTMLGIIIGVAAVVIVAALGAGTRQKVLAELTELGVSTIEVYPGKDWGDERAASIRTLIPEDAVALKAQPYIDSVSPVLSTPGNAQFSNVSVAAEIFGVGESYFKTGNFKLKSGRLFDQNDIRTKAQTAVIDDNTRKRLFPRDPDPIGKVILLKQMPVVVCGVLAPRTTSFGGRNLQIFLPFSTVRARIAGQDASLYGLTVRISPHVDTKIAENAVRELLTRRHGRTDFFIFNSDQFRKTYEKTARTMSLLISSVAAIALIIGGIGVMNIMLVSVTERTKEIGLRMAVGARKRDIMLQFQIEAIAICLTGAALGIGLALIICTVANNGSSDFPMVLTGGAIGIASVSAMTVGLLFGHLPARNAANLDPVAALSRE